ncbi:uncharacterized protein LOC118511464 isoform X2 [Anopheles stephensi]|uniref:uncharacterized protein LOC118511464 isoform X2 n=1 Tax=Anopheles stephensi TaxID=30069 RepID=UPI00165886E5|nr:uncharacterized protein LOC118511464 isoform X2 [Anopheles stephensi]
MLPGDLFLGGPGLPGSTMKLTPGVGMTLLIGIAGSIFLVAQSHRLLRSKLSQRRRSSRKPDAAECYMCNVNIELESTDSFATCRGCEKLVCRGENCCQWVESIGIWECTGCQSNRVIQQKAGEWLLNQLTARLKQPGPVELKEANLLGLGLDTDDARSTTSSTVSANQRIKVREFIEELLSTMLHGPLDDVSVGQLMKHESYIRLFRKFHTRLSRCLYNLELSIHHSLMSDLPLWEGQQQHHSPSDQHFELKQLIQKILDQIAKLPELLNHSGHPLRPEEHLPYFDPKKYEQLLATAVLNKVVDDYRNPKNFTSSGDVAGKSTGPATAYGTVDINHNQLSAEGSQPGLLSKETLRQMSVTADDVHLHEGISYTAPGERRLSDTDESYLSDYIQRHKVPLPDLSDTTGSGSGAEDDDLQSLKSNATDGTWEENWLFRKRQLKTTESSIAMLVPSPTEEVKALIGDKNADEISDLSEAGSDCEGYESDGNVNAGAAVPKPALVAASSSIKDTSEGISSSSKIRDSLEEHLAPDSLVSINSLPVNEEALSEATNSQLLAEQSTQSHTNGTAGLLIDDLISMEPVADKVETTNPAITNPFLDDAFEPNNNVITDDVKLLQRTEAGDNRSATESTSNGYGDRKEIPIDRAHQQPQPQDTHTYNSPSNPVVNVADTNSTNSSSDSSGDSVADSTTGNGASADNPPGNVDGSRSTNKPECFKQPKVSQQLLLLDNLSPPDSPVQQVLSPHPIMMTITDVFDRLANSSPLTAISEELPPAMLHDVVESEPLQESSLVESSLEAITEESSLPGEVTQTILSPADSVQVKQNDEDEYGENSSPLTDISEEQPPAMLNDLAKTEPVPEKSSILSSLEASIQESTPSGEVKQPILSPEDSVEVKRDDEDEYGENSSPLTDISEEQPPAIMRDVVETEPPQDTSLAESSLETTTEESSPSGEIKQPILSPADSVQAEQDDEAEYRTVSEATNNSLLLAESFDGLESFDTYEPANDASLLTGQDDEFCSLMDGNGSDRTTEASPDLLQIRETPPAALYVPNHEQLEFAEQLHSLEQPTLPAKADPFEASEEDKSSRITLQPDLVTFDNNAPSPEGPPGIGAVTEQMRAYCEELKGLLNHSAEVYEETFPPPMEPTDQWEMVESPEVPDALAAFQEELQTAANDPAQTEVRPCSNHSIRDEPLVELDECFPLPFEVVGLQMAEYSDSLKNIEYVQEAILMDEETVPLVESSIGTEDGSPQAILVSSPDLPPPMVTVLHTPSTEQPSTTVTITTEDPAYEDPSTNTDETMLASIESRSESKIEDTSMPFSDSELPSLSSPFTSFSTNLTFTNTSTINNCMSTNLTEQASPPNSIDTNQSSNSNESIVCEPSPDTPELEKTHDDQMENVADTCSIVAAQKESDQQRTDGGDDQTADQDASLDTADTLIPGSIAEREHMKWRNAKPIANNPYSPDALQRRLSEKSRPTSMIEIDRLVRKEATPVAGDTGVLMDDESAPKEPTDSGTENDRSLPSVTGGVLAEKKKIGREYYINDPERLRAGGAPVKQTLGVQQQQQQQQSHSTDDEKSLLLGRNLDDGAQFQQKLSPDPSNGSSLYRSSSFGKQRDPSAEDIFAARPIQVTADDPILKQGTKVNNLSTAAREIYLVPLEPEPHGSLMSTSSELSSVNSPTSSTARPELDSLTYSEDSDVTRIYDLTTGEAKVVRANQTESMHDTILQILPQSTPEHSTSQPVPAGTANVSSLKSQLSSSEDRPRRSPFPVKPLSPETIKFFAPKRKLSFTGSTNSLVSETAKGGAASEQGTTHVLPSMHSSLHIDYPASRTVTGCEFAIIEKDVIDVLPSVKELAKCYSGSTSDVSSMPPKPLYKPRDFIRQSSDVLNEEGMPSAGSKGQRQYSSTSSIAVRDEIREIRKLNLEAYRQSTYYPMAPGHSITARSLSKQIREHKANNVTDDHKVGQQEEEPLPVADGGMNGEGTSESNGDDGHTSPERPGSPVLLPGHLKSSIQFFENLRNKS